MDNVIIKNILTEMADYLNVSQMRKLQDVILKEFSKGEEAEKKEISNDEFLKMFIAAKEIEGISQRTSAYYRITVADFFKEVKIPVRKNLTDDIRMYLSNHQKKNNCGKVTIDNIRRNLSSFFSWLAEEDYILKSPMNRIHKVKTAKVVKKIISDEDIEKLRYGCDCLRDTAIINLLYSSGIRVGELVNLNIEDVDLENRECVVFGKGDKERVAYFDAKTKIDLQRYLDSRTDDNPALFVTLDRPYDRLRISGVEIRVRMLGRKLNLNVHPHKFRRTMATRAIGKGMPVEQVQKILGHSQLDTTMHYAMVSQKNVKMSHDKFLT